MRVELISITPNYMDVLKRAAGMCRGVECSNKTIESIIESGHLSVLEHCMASFEIRCSTRVLGQITRHRHLSFTAQSVRITTAKPLYVAPEKIKNDSSLHATLQDAMDMAYKFYDYLLRNGASPEDAAYVLPQGHETHFVVSGNFRSWLEYLPKRLCARALPEHRQVAEAIYDLLFGAAREIFGRDMLDCLRCKEKVCPAKC